MRPRQTLSLLLFVLLTAALAGCRSPQADNRDNVERAVRQYLASKPGLSPDTMQTQVRDVKFNGDQAVAEVIIQAKDNPEARMGMRYFLGRTGANQWKVQPEKSESLVLEGQALGDSQHPAAPPVTGVPEGHPPVREKDAEKPR